MSALEQRLIDSLRETREKVHSLERDLDQSMFDCDEAYLDVEQLEKLCEENDIEYP